MLHWNLEKSLVAIVCGHQAVIIIFQAHFLRLASVRGAAVTAATAGPLEELYSPCYLQLRLEALHTRVPHLNLSSQLAWELRGPRPPARSGRAWPQRHSVPLCCL